jgi:cytosine/uracil/thiamine/allantoin permease
MIVIADVKSHLAIHRSPPESSSCRCEYNHIWCALTCLYQTARQTLTYSVGMICFVLFWLIQFPFMFVSPQKIRWLFLAKSIIVPPTWMALLIWAMVKVPPSSGLLSQKEGLSGSALSWAWLSALNSALGGFSTLGVNIPDFTVGHTYATPSHILMYNNPNSEICQDRARVRKHSF